MKCKPLTLEFLSTINLDAPPKLNQNKYGNNDFWCILNNTINNDPVVIWKQTDSDEISIATAIDNFEAKYIVDALVNYIPPKDKNTFTKKETVFLEFGVAHFTEPYKTMASNAIIWNDREVYNRLIAKFSKFYA